jgi:hypothetical protein
MWSRSLWPIASRSAVSAAWTVALDRFLGHELVGDDAGVDPDDAVDERDQPVPAGTLHLAQPAQPEHHRALIFAIDPEALERNYEQQDQDDQGSDKRGGNEHGERPIALRRDPLPPSRLRRTS